MRDRRTVTVWAVAGLAAVATAVWRVLSFSGFTNDHYLHLARAQQMVLGDWPVRDFVDPGMPLMYLVSAVAELVGGRALWVELAVVAMAYACGSAMTLATAARLSGRLAVAVAVTGGLVILNPRSYSYPKVLLYALAGLLFTWAAGHPTRRRIAGLALLTAVAFLFRHDHGLYIGVGASVLLLCGETGGVRGSIRRILTFAGLVLLLLAPWALYVQYWVGLGEYFRSGIEFSRHEASATAIETLPVLRLGAPLRANATAWLFYLFHLLPLVAAALAWWPPAGGGSGRRATAAAVSGIAAMALLANAGFLREELVPRIPDAAASAAMLGAYCLGRWLDAWPSRLVVRTVCRVAAAAVLAITMASCAALADLEGQVDKARLAGGIGHVLGRLDDLRLRLARAMPEDEQVPSRHAAAMMPLFDYLGRCTLPTDRMLLTGNLMPEAFVLAHRGFAGGHPAYFSGYYSGQDDQFRAVERMRHESVPVVVVSEDFEHFRATMPIVAAFVEENYVKGADIEVERNPPLAVYFPRFAAGTPDPATGWPCLHPNVSRR
jgi:hypothetical protein